MPVRSLALLVCTLAAYGCGGSGSRSQNTASSPAGGNAAATSGSTTAPTSSSTTPPPPPPPPPPNFQAVAFDTVDQGDQSPRGFAQGAHEVQVATDSDWASFWPTNSQAPLPTVDFSTHTVVGTFLGQQPSGGHGTQVVGVARDQNSDDLRLLVRERHPGSWRATPSVLTSPFHLVRAATAVSGAGALSVTRQEILDFEVIGTGSDNAIGAGNTNYAGGLMLFRDGASFQAFYAQLQPGRTPPVVDFQREMVVAVLGPYVASFGNTVRTRRVLHDPAQNAIRVIWRVDPYRGGAAPPPATETPFQLLRVTPAPGAIRAEQTTAVTPNLLASGRSSVHRGSAETQVIRDAATFARVWQTRVGATPPPVVDFAVDQVVFAIEPAGSARTLGIGRCVLLEDDELSVTVQAATGIVGPIGASYVAVTTPRTTGPATFETVDITPVP